MRSRNSSRSRRAHRSPVSRPRSGPLAAGDVLPVDLLGELLPERMELEVLRQQDAREVRMARVFDAHQVPHLPFEEVRGMPEARQGRDLRVVVRDLRVHLDHAAVVVVLDVVDAFEVVLPVDRGDTREMLEAERVLQVRAHRDELGPVDHDLDEALADDLRILQLRTEGNLQLREDLLLGPGHRPSRDRRRGRDDRAHIWMTSSFLSAYWVATNMIPRNRKIENLATGDTEFRRPPHAKAQRRRKIAATSKMTKMSANM